MTRFLRLFLFLLTLTNLNFGFVAASYAEDSCRATESSQSDTSAKSDCHESATGVCECNDCFKCAAPLTLIPPPRESLDLGQAQASTIFHATDSYFTLYPLALIRPPSRA